LIWLAESRWQDRGVMGRGDEPERSRSDVPAVPAEHRVSLRVNGVLRELRLDPRVTLLDALRERCGLTGTKKGCDQGACGACTVLADGRRVLHPVQRAFIAHDAFQCGFCTPGQILSAVALLAEGRAGSDADIREFMSGNICRCGAYPNIVAAIREVAEDPGRAPV
jgi:xanthine dehydrogenase YagT iron-sulfur-binding subunit